MSTEVLTDTESPCRRFREADFGGPSVIAVAPVRDVFHDYLRDAPLAHALFRSAECRRLASVRLAPPALDLGCGVGEFAVHALRGRVDIGVDLVRHRLTEAKRSNRYGALVQGDAADLPVADQCVATVLAVSVCEHLYDPQRAVAEIYRVLKPGGRFVATIVLADLHAHLLYPRLLRKIGLTPLAGLYLHCHDKLFAHREMRTRQWWERRLVEAGFQLVASRRIIAPRLVAWIDFWLATAWPYRLWRPFGTLRIWRPTWLERLWWRTLERLDTDDDDGAVLFVVAERPATVEQEMC